MALSINKECHGIEPYNFLDTKDIVATITANVGQSTAIGPKVAIRKNKPFPKEGDVVCLDMGGGKSSSNVSLNVTPTLSCTHGGEPIIGTIDAHIYLKNNFQDNSKYIITSKRRESKMDETRAVEELLECMSDGQEIKKVMTIIESVLEGATMRGLELNEVLGAIKKLNAEKVKSEDGQKERAKPMEQEDNEEVCIVRRLTPTETSRLQGFPDDYTKIDGPETADAPQFKAHGNSWATPCANFFSTRIEMELRRMGKKGAIKYATCCSGIEAHSVSVSKLEWESVFFSEIENFPCRVLEKHYPQTPNLGDMTQIHYDAVKGVISNEHKEGEEYSLPNCFREAPIQEIPFKLGELDVFSGGTPCQSISVAGKREGMAEGSGTRSSLAFHYQRIIDESRPMFTLWENVPGAFTSNNGADFIWFVNRCAESGYSMAWRVIDAQYTMTEEYPRAVPQRRRRIWLVGFKGNDWRVAARVCFEKVKDLTYAPPKRVPGKGFNEAIDGYIESLPREEAVTKPQNTKDLFIEEAGEGDGTKLLKVSRMISFEEMPNESDFSKVSMADVYQFAQMVGEPGYIGSVFRTDKKGAKKKVVEETYDLFGEYSPEVKAEEEKSAASGSEDWEGAERITPAILENIGNAGILANGRICTMNCAEWTSGIQLLPSTMKGWEKAVSEKDYEGANNLLPKAYDETVSGLSDVLQDEPPEKYNLSWRACFGILKRAETRGKELPPALEIALKSTLISNAKIVKWVILNGKDTKKNDNDVTERESAEMCYQKYIASVIDIDSIEAESPKKRGTDESVEDEECGEEVNEEEVECEDDGECLREHKEKAQGVKTKGEEMPSLPNGVINVGGGETAATLIASGDAAVGTTQDANVIALKK